MRGLSPLPPRGVLEKHLKKNSTPFPTRIWHAAQFSPTLADIGSGRDFKLPLWGCSPATPEKPHFLRIAEGQRAARDQSIRPNPTKRITRDPLS